MHYRKNFLKYTIVDSTPPKWPESALGQNGNIVEEIANNDDWYIYHFPVYKTAGFYSFLDYNFGFFKIQHWKMFTGKSITLLKLLVTQSAATRVRCSCLTLTLLCRLKWLQWRLPYMWAISYGSYMIAFAGNSFIIILLTFQYEIFIGYVYQTLFFAEIACLSGNLLK